MVKREAGRALDVIVSPVAKRVVGADDNLLAAAGKLGRGELLFVVPLEGGPQLGNQARVRGGEGLDV